MRKKYICYKKKKILVDLDGNLNGNQSLTIIFGV